MKVQTMGSLKKCLKIEFCSNRIRSFCGRGNNSLWYKYSVALHVKISPKAIIEIYGEQMVLLLTLKYSGKSYCIGYRCRVTAAVCSAASSEGLYAVWVRQRRAEPLTPEAAHVLGSGPPPAPEDGNPGSVAGRPGGFGRGLGRAAPFQAHRVGQLVSAPLGTIAAPRRRPSVWLTKRLPFGWAELFEGNRRNHLQRNKYGQISENKWYVKFAVT